MTPISLRDGNLACLLIYPWLVGNYHNRDGYVLVFMAAGTFVSTKYCPMGKQVWA